MRIGEVVQVGDREVPGWQPDPNHVPEPAEKVTEKTPEKEPEKVN